MSVFQNATHATNLWVKGKGFTLEKLLGSKDLAQEYENGAFVIARLSPQDYHVYLSSFFFIVNNLK